MKMQAFSKTTLSLLLIKLLNPALAIDVNPTETATPIATYEGTQLPTEVLAPTSIYAPVTLETSTADGLPTDLPTETATPIATPIATYGATELPTEVVMPIETVLPGCSLEYETVTVTVTPMAEVTSEAEAGLLTGTAYATPTVELMPIDNTTMDSVAETNTPYSPPDTTDTDFYKESGSEVIHPVFGILLSSIMASLLL